VLGKATRRERWYGPVVDLPTLGLTNQMSPRGYSDIWRLVYEFPGGGVVCLDFDGRASSWEDWRLVEVFSANTNNFVRLHTTNGPAAIQGASEKAK
jgi:hypothetical protein